MTGTRSGALEYVERHRNVSTGMYNEKRLTEKPIPEHDENVYAIEEVIIPAGSDIDSFSRESNPLDASMETNTVSSPNADSTFETSFTADLSGENELNEPNEFEESVAVTVSSTNMLQEPTTSTSANTSASDSFINSFQSDSIDQERSTSARANTSASDSLVISFQSESIDQNGESFVQMQHETGNQGASDNSNDVKPNIVPMYAVYTENNDDILQQLEDWTVEIVDDDMEIMVSSKGFGNALGVTVDGLVKPEKPQEFSGMIPYLDTVNIFFL